MVPSIKAVEWLAKTNSTAAALTESPLPMVPTKKDVVLPILTVVVQIISYQPVVRTWKVVVVNIAPTVAVPITLLLLVDTATKVADVSIQNTDVVPMDILQQLVLITRDVLATHSNLDAVRMVSALQQDLTNKVFTFVILSIHTFY